MIGTRRCSATNLYITMQMLHKCIKRNNIGMVDRKLSCSVFLWDNRWRSIMENCHCTLWNIYSTSIFVISIFIDAVWK